MTGMYAIHRDITVDDMNISNGEVYPGEAEMSEL